MVDGGGVRIDVSEVRRSAVSVETSFDVGAGAVDGGLACALAFGVREFAVASAFGSNGCLVVRVVARFVPADFVLAGVFFFSFVVDELLPAATIAVSGRACAELRLSGVAFAFAFAFVGVAFAFAELRLSGVAFAFAGMGRSGVAFAFAFVGTRPSGVVVANSSAVPSRATCDSAGRVAMIAAITRAVSARTIASADALRLRPVTAGPNVSDT